MADSDLELRVNRMDLVARWADDIAHEIKNPIHAMVINLELVKRRAGASDPEPLVKRAQVVESELHRVHALVESLLRLLRPWDDRSQADVDRAFADLMPVLTARTRARKIEFAHTTGGAPVPMPPGHLALILLNIVDNAIAATPEGGSVTTGCQASDTQVRITVQDTGAGPPVHPPGRVLEPDVPARPGHAGLGLAIVQRLVHAVGGTVELEAGPGGHGTLATIRLPRVGAA